MSAPGSQRPDVLTTIQAMVAESRELQSAAGGPVTDAVAAWLAPQDLLAAQSKLAATDVPGRFEMLRLLVQDLSLLRRGDHASARLQLDRERFAARQASAQSAQEAEFREWIKQREIREEFIPDRLGDRRQETQSKIEKEVRLL